MNRYLVGGILGAIALLTAFSAGIGDWVTSLADGTSGAAGVRATALSTDTSTLTPLEKAGRSVKRQSNAVASSGQNTPGGTAANGQNVPGGTGATGQNTTGGTATNPQNPQPSVRPAGTPPPANLDAIPALW